MSTAVSTEAQTPSAGSPAIAVRDLRFRYPGGADVLHIPEFHLQRGQHAFLYGPSGSGKTTLLGLVAGVLEVQQGSLHVLGADLGALNAARRDAFRASNLGYIFQMFNLIAYLSVEENIMLPCQVSPERRRRLNGADLREEARRLARHLGLGDYLHRNVLQLSVGQQQRVAAARAMIGAPSLLIADEPTSALDYDHRGRFLDLLFERCDATGATLLFVSHDQTLMGRFQTQVALSDINRAAPQPTQPPSAPNGQAG
ncbi:MAG: ABC transporter ATP-binding protein [Bryobacterales bacterium]|jgi:putative ABC transport system ATP-binding protein|nr:ABC transporter ATP-binding protein [Bryobacterales bacterium]